MGHYQNLFLFSINEQKYAIDLFAVDKVIPAVEIIHTPDDNEVFLGIINVYGKLIPVVNIRHLLNIPFKPIDIDDFIVIVNRPFLSSFIVDKVHDVILLSEEEVVNSSDIHCDLKSIEGFVKIDGEVIFIHDIGKIISSANIEPEKINERCVALEADER